MNPTDFIPAAVAQAFQATLLKSLNFAIESDPELHAVCRGLAGRKLRIKPAFLQSTLGSALPNELLPPEWVAADGFEFAFAADGLLDSLEVSADPDLTLVLTSPSRDGLRIEGNALLAEKLAPLSALVTERIESARSRLQSVPWVSQAQAAVKAAASSGEWVLSQAQFNDTAARLRKLREGLDRVERRLASRGGMGAPE